MLSDVEQILIGPQEIADRVSQVAQTIASDLPAHHHDPGGHNRLTIVPILTGSIIFLADLIRQLPVFLQIQLISVNSYPGTSTTPGKLKILSDIQALNLQGRDVLLVDDILDSGQTLTAITQELKHQSLASLHTCVLLRKKRSEPVAFEVDYACFDIPDEFVVGYGLDYNGYYRNLPYIATLRPEAIRRQVNKDV